MKVGMDPKPKLQLSQCPGYFGQGIEKFIAEAQITEILDILLHFAFEPFKMEV
jgi:hypothetical protein